ncbi:hypothetical protein JCM19237_2128 [Photobacterium aphoticum]|uniref:Uncharacterized protein n=1 Tax=Photobacterium aphoticum TaxID=754436 RepID=A0A090R8S5_9GAMM|nr:hypothetical protein JCM19237_2128 [Photobacterium aphoticum]
MLASAAELLEGMKTAFYTSLAGLSLSAVFMARMKYSSSALSKAQQAFIEKVSHQYFEVSPIYYLKNLSNEGQEEAVAAQLRSANAMVQMSDKFGATAESLNQLGQQFNGDVIAKQVSEGVSASIERYMTPALNAMTAELATLKDIKEQSQKELVELLVTEMRNQLIEPVTSVLEKTNAAVEESNQVSSQLNSNVERVITSTSETVETINEFQKETMVKLQAFAESLRVILTDFKDDTQGAMSKIAQEVNSMLNDASQGMDLQRAAFEQSAERASSAFEGMKESLETALEQRQSAEKDMFENVTGRIHTLLNEMAESFDNQAVVITKTGETASLVINQAQTEFEKSVQMRRDEESTLFGEMKSQISELLDNVTQSFENQTAVIAQTGETASTLMNKAQADFETSVTMRRAEESSMFDEMQSRIGGLLDSVSTSFENQTVVIAQTGETASALMNKAQADFETSVAMRREEESSMFDGMQSRIGGLLDSVSTSFENQTAVIAQTGETASTLMNKAQADFETSVTMRRAEESSMFDGMQSRIGGLLDSVSTSFENQTAVIAQTGETASTLMNKAQADFETSVKMRRDEESHLFTEMETRMGNLVENAQLIFKEQADAIKQVGDDASSVMHSAKTELQQGLGDIDSKVKSMSETVQTELEAFRQQYQQNLTSYFDQQNNLLEESLGKQRDGLNGVVENFRQVFEGEYKARHNLLQELTAQYEKLQASAQTVERVAKAIGLNEAAKMAELQDAAQTMGREIAQLKKEYAKASATFTDITENLPKAMDEYFTRANESFETFFKDFDQSASTIHNKLSQAAGYLINSQVVRREFEADEVNA